MIFFFSIDFIFEATRQEHVILAKEFHFNRTFWVEHLATWSIGQFDILEYRPSEKFFFFLQNRFIAEPPKACKECNYFFFFTFLYF